MRIHGRHLLLLALALGLAGAAQAADEDYSGDDLYRVYCASCHGSGGRGDGPLAASLRAKPPDLCQIAARNDGKFPDEKVMKLIDGRATTKGHGSDMPVWGDAFGKSGDSGDGDRVKRRVGSLTEYLKEMQDPAKK